MYAFGIDAGIADVQDKSLDGAALAKIVRLR